MSVWYAPEAQEDRSRIWLESALRLGEQNAGAYSERIDATLTKSLGTFPNSGRARPEFGPDVRSFPMVPYVAFYRVKNRRVEIIRILHGYRDLVVPLLSLFVAV